MAVDSNKRKILKNVYWATIGKAVNILCGVFVGVLVARYLGPTDFGVMNYVISFVTLFSVLSNFGMDSIEIRELALDPKKRNIIMGTALSLRILLAVIAIIAVVITTTLFKTDWKTTLMIWIYSVSLIFGSLNVIRNYFTSIVLNEYVVKTEILRNLIGAGIKIGLLLLHASLFWFIIASTFDFVLIGTGYMLSYKSKIGDYKSWTFDLSISKMLLKESFPLLLSGTAIVIYQRIDQVMISNMISDTSNGYFSVAARFVDLAMFIPTIVAQTVAPLLVKSYNDNKEEYYIKRQYFMNVVTWSGIIIAFIMSISAYWVVTILYGVKYLPAVAVLQIMSWKAVGSSLFASSSQIIITEGIQKLASIRNVIALAICVSLNFWLIPMLGINGSAIAGVFTILFAGFITHFFIKPYRDIFFIQCKAIFSGWKSLRDIIINKSI